MTDDPRSFADDFNVVFKEQADFFRQKVSLPSKSWRELTGNAHDRAFVVAGVEKEAVLTELRAAIDKAIARGTTLEEFRKDFDRTVAKHGWIGGAGENNTAWRTRVIYETNIRTSRMAGRLKQLRDPDVLALRPYWMYRHADLRQPLKPREEHADWDGLVLLHDDPWWKTHFPPNGWLCSCGIRPLSRREATREQEKRGKASMIDDAPPLNLHGVVDPKTGETVMVPSGIDFGWDHMPGDSWERGLVPPELQRPLPAAGEAAPDVSLPPLSDYGRASAVRDLPAGSAIGTYVDAVLGMFGAGRGENGASVYRDEAGGAVVISEAMFQASDGLGKAIKRTVGGDYLRAAEALKDPDEIWVDWETDERTSRPVLRRRYIRYDGDRSSVAVFTWGQNGWEAENLFAASGDGADPERQAAWLRHGAMLYRRKLAGAAS
ncbi:PBECR2 nuclease fold domain-containing protein [Camelimonas lactis]|uniref:Phage Mu protein F like protein n=1 Tax=Camelimonas lactis TaxID=659006 RepID=A0A4R2GZ67_9HYPH|nr:PBECR2 nuclease fold domain-containing protein [Camelimonas lactis]TCO15192.1 phage Mu protein F like protein [Camelimonas lactis]